MSIKTKDSVSTEDGRAGHDYCERPDSTTDCRNTPFNPASHLKRLEAQSAEMTDDEAKFRLLYELSVS